MICEYVRSLPAGIPELQVMGGVADGLAPLQRMEHSRDFLETVLLDMKMPKMHGSEIA